jgi:hypothetical protein
VPYLYCYCDQRINLNDIPLARGLRIYREDALEDALQAVADLFTHPEIELAARRRRLWFNLFGFRNPRMRRAVQCDSCGRLLVLNDSDDVVQIFIPDSTEPASREGRCPYAGGT